MRYRANLYGNLVWEYENACQLIADTQASLSALELGQQLGLGFMGVKSSLKKCLKYGSKNLKK